MKPRYRLRAAALLLVAAPATIAANTVTVVRVVDGDTIKVELNGRVESVRLIGVDTPETVDPRKPVQYFGREASAFTKSLAEGKTVRLESDQGCGNRDGYGRLLRYVFLPDGKFLNAEIIAQGYGHAYTRFPFTRMDEFRALEREAREEERGLWGPEAMPRAAPSEPARAAPSTIVYVTATGSKYHREGCRYLARNAIPMLLEGKSSPSPKSPYSAGGSRSDQDARDSAAGVSSW